MKRSAHLYKTREGPIQPTTQFVPTELMAQPIDTVILLTKRSSEWIILKSGTQFKGRILITYMPSNE